MPIKFIKRVPPPQPQPPATYGVTGLSLEESKVLKRAVDFSNESLIVWTPEERRVLDRISTVLGGNPQEEGK